VFISQLVLDEAAPVIGTPEELMGHDAMRKDELVEEVRRARTAQAAR
jgi:hypothetical protein